MYSGPIYPFVFSGSGVFSFGTDEEVINSAIKIILGTEIGGYPIDKNFGSYLIQVLFLNVDDVTVKSMVDILIREALGVYEDRIIINSILTQKKAGTTDSLNIFIDYQIIATGEEGSVEVET